MRQEMRRLCQALAIFMAITAIEGESAKADSANLRFASTGLGSSWYIYATGVANIAKPLLPAGYAFSILPIAGAIGNIKLIQKGEAELGLSVNVTSSWACRGTNAFKAKQNKVRSLVGGLDGPGHYLGAFVTKKSGIDSFDQIVSGTKKTRILTAQVGGIGEYGVRQTLTAYGSSYDAIRKLGGSVKSVKRAATLSQISDGHADMWMHSVPKGHPVVLQLMAAIDMKMLPLSDEVIQKLTGEGWEPAVIPPNKFPKQPTAIKTVKAPTNLLAAASLPDDVAYAITKAIVEKAKKLGTFHTALADFNPKEAAKPALNGCPLHPGAARYYKEKGLM